MEQARRPAKASFTEAAERVLKAGGVLEALQEEVDLAKLPQFFRDFAIIEAEAVSRFEYELLLIPGLLQTEEYARALLAGHCPPLSEDAIEQHVEARLSRQKLLTRTPIVDVSLSIGETVLPNPLGGPEVMRPQLRHLLEVGLLRNVEIQVMPATRGYHSGLDGAFVVLETPEHTRVGYVESQEVGTVVSDSTMVSSLGLRHGKLRSQALNVEESARLIERVAGEI